MALVLTGIVTMAMKLTLCLVDIFALIPEPVVLTLMSTYWSITTTSIFITFGKFLLMSVWQISSYECLAKQSFPNG